jgi:phosphodiesterase/alkaline phosphatase D-like protein
VSKTKSSGVVAWATNLPASGRVYYGQNTTALTQSVAVASSSVSHQATITGLDARKRYYYQVEAVDTSGTNVKSPVTEFRTRR